jgi:hypothetical protein
MKSIFSGSSATVFKEAPEKRGTERYQGRIPKVIFTSEALYRQWLLVNNVDKEVGWLGVTRRQPNGDILVDKIILFDQEVTSTTTVITAAGLSDVAEKMIDEGNEDEIEMLRFWGHSHVEMATNPSGQDDQQMKEFEENGADYFVRAIFNKKGCVRIDIFDYARSLVFEDVGWSVQTSNDEDDISKEVKASIAKLVREKSVFAVRYKYKHGAVVGGYGGGCNDSKPAIGFQSAIESQVEAAESAASATEDDEESGPIVLNPNPNKKRRKRHGR